MQARGFIYYHLQSIAKVCLAGQDGAAATRTLCEKIRQGFADYSFRAYSHEGLLSCLFTLQPRVALDAFFPSGPVAQELELDVDYFEGIGDRPKNPLDGIPLPEMLQWCDEAPELRYLALAKVVGFYAQKANELLEWTPLALTMLDRAPDPAAILHTFVQRFSPRSWSGSRAEIVESRARLLDRLPQVRQPHWRCDCGAESSTRRRRRSNPKMGKRARQGTRRTV